MKIKEGYVNNSSPSFKRKIINSHTFAREKCAFIIILILIFAWEPAKHCICDQWIACVVAGSCRLFLRLPIHAKVWAFNWRVQWTMDMTITALVFL